MAGFALLGAAVFAGIAASQGLSPSSVDFWKITLTGALLGAAIGAGVATLSAVMASSATLTVSAAQWALTGAALGAVEETIAHFASGGSVDNLLGGLMANIAISFIIGGALGKLAKSAASAARHAGIVRSLERLRGVRGWLPRLAASIRFQSAKGVIWLLEVGKWGNRIKRSYALIASWQTGENRQLGADLFKAVVFQNPGQVFLLENAVDLGQSGVGAARNLKLNELF